MKLGFFVTGTDTEVGKTVVTAGLGLCAKARGLTVGVLKPLATGSAQSAAGDASPDAEYLRKILDLEEDESAIAPIVLSAPLSPFTATRLEGRSLDLAPARARFADLCDSRDVVLVEGIGGIMVPLGTSFYVLDIIKEFGLPAVVVARSGLGTINHTLLTVQGLARVGVPVAGIILNRAGSGPLSEAEKSSHEEIARFSHKPVLGILDRLDDVASPEAVRGAFEQAIDVECLLSLPCEPE